MAVVKELLRSEANGEISFGDYTLATKQKVEDFEHLGDLYKVKTFAEITKLEKNGMFLYESVPGTSVHDFKEQADVVSFTVEGREDAQITVGMKEETDYEIFLQGESIGTVNTGFSGKVNLSIELAGVGETTVRIAEA